MRMYTCAIIPINAQTSREAAAARVVETVTHLPLDAVQLGHPESLESASTGLLLTISTHIFIFFFTHFAVDVAKKREQRSNRFFPEDFNSIVMATLSKRAKSQLALLGIRLPSMQNDLPMQTTWTRRSTGEPGVSRCSIEIIQQAKPDRSTTKPELSAAFRDEKENMSHGSTTVADRKETEKKESYKKGGGNKEPTATDKELKRGHVWVASAVKQKRARLKGPCRDGASCKALFAILCAHFGGKNPNRCAVPRRQLRSFPVEEIVCRGAYFHTWNDVYDILHVNAKWCPFILAKAQPEFDQDLAFDKTQVSLSEGKTTEGPSPVEIAGQYDYEGKEERRDRLARLGTLEMEVAYLERRLHFIQVDAQCFVKESEKKSHAKQVETAKNSIQEIEVSIETLQRQLDEWRGRLKKLESSAPTDHRLAAAVETWRHIMADGRSQEDIRKELQQKRLRLNQLQKPCPMGRSCENVMNEALNSCFKVWCSDLARTLAAKCPFYHSRQDLKFLHAEATRLEKWTKKPNTTGG